MTGSLQASNFIDNLKKHIGQAYQYTYSAIDGHLLIKNDDISVELLIDEEEINAELANVCKVIDGAVYLNDSTLQFVLTLDEILEEDIVIEGFYTGRISKLMTNQYGIIIYNHKLIDTSKINETGSFELKNLLFDNLYLCDIRIPAGTSTKKENIKIIKTSILMDTSYSKIQKFRLFEDHQTTNRLVLKTYSNVNTIRYHDEIPLSYFLLAEKIEYTNFKYLEYYHVIEYYFMVFSKKRISKIMSDLVTDVFLKNKSLNEEFLYDTYKKFMNPHRIKEEEFSELNQLLKLFQIVEYDSLVDILNASLKPAFLYQDFSFINNTKINIDNCFNSDKKRLIRNCTEEEQKHFLELLAKRIYKIRNYIVHTKKGEIESSVFHPAHNNLEKLNDDVILIREVSRLFLIMAATSNDFQIN